MGRAGLMCALMGKILTTLVLAIYNARPMSVRAAALCPLALRLRRPCALWPCIVHAARVRSGGWCVWVPG